MSNKLSVNVETPNQARNSKEDGFFTTLAALRQVLTPTNTQQQPVVQLLQKEKQDMIQEMNRLREDTQQQLKSAQEAARNKTLEHAEEVKQYQQRLVQQEERANVRYKELEVEMAHYVKRLEKVRQETEQAMQQAKEENQSFTESMIQLELENKTLQERCEQVEMTNHKLQTELNQRTTASEQSNVALSKLGKLLQQKESSTAEMLRYKQKTNEALVTASDLQSRLQQAEHELSLLKFKMQQEETKKVESRVIDDEGSTANKVAPLQKELAEKTSAHGILLEHMNQKMATLQSQLAAKDALQEGNEKMLVAFQAQVEKLQQHEKQQKVQHAAEMASLKEEWEETRDELKCAEAEVLRGRTRIQELESRILDPSNALLKEMDQSITVVARSKVADPNDAAERNAKQVVESVEPPGDTQVRVQKRKADEQQDTDAPEEQLDSTHAKPFVKKR